MTSQLTIPGMQPPLDFDADDVRPLFSPCGRYRYRLDYRWAPGPRWTWIMLNPSVAGSGAERDNLDATLRRCKAFTQAGGGGAFTVCNLFSFVGQDPASLWAARARGVDIAGPNNDQHVLGAVDQSRGTGGLVVAGWGSFSKGRTEDRMWGADQATAMVRRLRDRGFVLHALAVTKHPPIQPRHPLYLRGGLQPRPLVDLLREGRR